MIRFFVYIPKEQNYTRVNEPIYKGNSYLIL